MRLLMKRFLICDAEQAYIATPQANYTLGSQLKLSEKIPI